MKVLLPHTMRELFDALAEPGARVLAGGTDLLVRLRAGREQAGVLVGLERIKDLRGVEEEHAAAGELDRSLRLGATCTHAELLEHPLVRARLPVLARALAELASPPIRNMATLGGNICTASPAGDCLPPLYALGAELELASARGLRRMPLHEFIAGPGRTRLAEDEILAAVRVPLPPPQAVQHFEKVGRRNALAVAVVSLAAVILPGRGGLTERAALAWGSVGPTVWRCPEAEAALAGRRLSLSALKGAAGIVRASVAPMDDVRASAEYRRQVAGNLLLRLACL